MKISTTLNSKTRNIIIKIGVPIFWVLLWWLGAKIVGSNLVLPSPLRTLEGLIELIRTKELYISLGATLLRVFGGVFVSVLLGMILGLIGGLNQLFYELLDPFVVVIKSLPVVSVIILINLWINSAIVPLVVTFLVCFPIAWINIVQGVRSTDPKLLEMAELYNVPKGKKIREIYIPALKPFGISALMSAIGLGWKVTVTAEVLANALPSVGMNLYYSKIYLETDLLFAWTLVIVICSYMIEKITLYFIGKTKKGGKNAEYSN